MSPTVSRNVLRAIILLLFQGLVFRSVNLGWSNFAFIQVFVYPLFLLMLPIKISKAWALVIAFIYGFAIDMFYHSPGLHTAAALITVFARPLLLNYFEPRGGYKVSAKPTKDDLGSAWFYRFVAAGFAIHLTAYFLIEAFTLLALPSSLLRATLCFIPSMAIILLYTTIFNLKE